MHYIASGASPSCGSPRALLGLISDQSVAAQTKAKTNAQVAAESAAIGAALTPAQAKASAGLLAVNAVLEAVPGKDPESKAAQRKAWESLSAAEAAREALLHEIASTPKQGQQEQLAALNAAVKQAAAALDPKLLTSLRSAQGRQREALTKYLQVLTRQQIAKLNLRQQSKALESLKAQVPGWVWHRIVRLTGLRASYGDTTWYSDSIEAKARANSDASSASAWLSLMKAWDHESESQWRGLPDGDVADYVSTIVCNEMVGLYLSRVGDTGHNIIHRYQQFFQQNGTFKRLTAADDLRRGAVLFYADWDRGQRNQPFHYDESFVMYESAALDQSDTKNLKRLDNQKIDDGGRGGDYIYHYGPQGVWRERAANAVEERTWRESAARELRAQQRKQAQKDALDRASAAQKASKLVPKAPPIPAPAPIQQVELLQGPLPPVVENYGFHHVAIVADVPLLSDGERWVITLEANVFDDPTPAGGRTHVGTGVSLDRHNRVVELITRNDVYIGYVDK